MIKDENRTKELVEKYIKKRNDRWELANSILYEMCKNYPFHVDENEIVAKLWLVGRSYAAAIERRRTAKDFSGDFYYDVVAPKILEIGTQLDDKINSLIVNIEDTDFLNRLFDCHGFLTKTFKELTKLEKRSLASKYLHFHKPQSVYIYDSITRSNINKLVKKDNKIIELYNNYDKEYVDYCVRVLELQKFIQNECGLKFSTREMDTFLLNLDI